MIRLIISIFFISSVITSYAQSTAKEKVAMAYYAGFEKNIWDSVAAQFADDFTFTSPNNDDHINVQQFKQKCWPTAGFIKKVKYIKMIEKGNILMLLVEISTSDNKTIRNVDVFNFNTSSKIKSIEVFFGAGGKYPGNKY
jgi:hypothetical protein